jgi:uncharacterized membrane protein YciS (DUF1049 family)
MSAKAARLFLTLASLVVSGFVFFLSPFGFLLNAIITGVFFLAVGALAEYVYRQLAIQDQKIADLRDRVDNPP